MNQSLYKLVMTTMVFRLLIHTQEECCQTKDIWLLYTLYICMISNNTDFIFSFLLFDKTLLISLPYSHVANVLFTLHLTVALRDHNFI